MSSDWSTDTQATPVLQGRRGSVVALVLALALVVGVVVELAPRLAVPPQVARLRVVNPTAYQLNVDVAANPGGPWLDLGTVGRERTKTIEQVLDQGRRWVFRFSYGGVDAGTIAVGRSALATAAWTVRAPDSAGPPPSAKMPSLVSVPTGEAAA
jgi:hypothetical protein